MIELTWRAFLHDRRLYIGMYAAFALLTIVVVQLDLALSGASLQYVNLAYIFLLGLVGLAIFLAIDYRRQLAFFQHLARTSTASLDQMGVLEPARTIEQQIFSEAWQRMYGRLRAELVQEQNRGQERVHLLSQWAHHMKTPLAVIDLELQKARSTLADVEPVQPFLASVAEENQRLEHSLQMLLNTIRLDDFAADFRVERVDLPQLVRQVVNDSRRAFITHRVYPKLEEPHPDVLPPARLQVESDVKWLRFVIEQIIDNSIKYSARSDGEGRVNIRFHAEDDELVLEIADNGIGIAPEDIGRVFQPFFTGVAGREYAKSTGMGLYLAHEACRQLGHRITVESTRHVGTRVRIHFRHDPSIYVGLKGAVFAR